MSFWQQLPKPFTALAPMAGVTDAAFRKLCKAGGADVVYTEFVSVDAIAHESKKTLEMLAFDASEQPVVAQLFGRKPEYFRNAAKVVSKLGVAGIDINFGCPAYKIVKNGGGVCLMRTPKLAAEIVAATIEGAGATPVSIKCRASITKQPRKNEVDYDPTATDRIEGLTGTVTAVDFLDAMKDLPIAAVMLHGRSYEQPFDGTPDPEIYTRVRTVYHGVLIANGGIATPEDAKQLFDSAPIDGIGIARGAWGKPWLFHDIKTFLATGSYAQKTLEEIKNVMRQHALMALAEKGPYGMIELRKHLAWYVKGFSGAAELRKQLVHVKTIGDLESILSNWQSA